ncbi:MAG: DUF3127 domain-containing protein [Methylococcales bacterium]
MELAGKIIDILDEQKGESSRGPWRKQELILETEGEYPKKVCFMAWGDKIDDFKLKANETVIVSINLESREYNGRWYTDVKAWKVTRNGEAMTQSSPPASSEMAPQPTGSALDFDEEIPF